MASARAPRLPAKPTAVGQRTAPPPHARRTGTQRLLTTSSPHSHALPPRASPPRLALGAVCVKENVPGTGVRTISWTCEGMRGDHPCMARSSKQGPWRFSKNAADLVLEPRGSPASSAPRRSNTGRTTWPSPPERSIGIWAPSKGDPSQSFSKVGPPCLQSPGDMGYP